MTHTQNKIRNRVTGQYSTMDKILDELDRNVHIYYGTKLWVAARELCLAARHKHQIPDERILPAEVLLAECGFVVKPNERHLQTSFCALVFAKPENKTWFLLQHS
jgi:hypothetical protein